MRLRSWRRTIPGVVLLSLIVVAGCGSMGYAPPLSSVTHASLVSAAGTSGGTVTAKPVYATHLVVYYAGIRLPLTGAAHPAQLRQGSCTGTFIASLTDGNVVQPGGGASHDAALTQPDPAGGVDVAITPSASLYVIVLDHPNDANAGIIACGNPLSARRQYFSLFPPIVGNNGIGRGTALFDPILATSLSVKLAAPATTGMRWSVRTPACDSQPIASGVIPSGTGTFTTTVFRALTGTTWWVAISGADGTTWCGNLSA